MTTARDLLGKTTLIDIFAYYDRPVLFSCKNETERLFIAVLVEEGIDERWLYAEVSETRLALIRRGEIDFHDAFALAESGTLLEIQATLRAIAASSVPDDDLPARGERA